jgi:hypothetical protein
VVVTEARATHECCIQRDPQAGEDEDMLLRTVILALAVAGSALGSSATLAQGDPRLGRLYFRSICTDCHVRETGKAIPPNQLTIAEWEQYFDTDRHDASGRFAPSVREYTGRAHRESIQATNKVAQRFLSVGDAEMHANVRAWLVSAAKDSDRPSGCD